jgi:hypothetical protein
MTERRSRSLAGACALAFVVVHLAAPAAADQAPNAALAQRLFEEARSLVSAGRYDEACPKFAESQRLDAAVGTLLNLAQCYEKTRRLASAWATYKDAETAANLAGQHERAASAAARAEALAGSIPYVVIDVPRPAPGLVVRCAGREIGSAAWGIAIPVDPGSVRIEANAPSRGPWAREVAVRIGERVPVTLPELALADGPSGEGSRPGRNSTLALIAFAGGAALVAGGVVTAVVSIDQYKAANRDHCTPQGCDDAGLKQIDSAKHLAVASQVALVLGAAGLAGGLYLWLARPRANGAGVRAAVAPTSVKVEATF